MIYYLKRKIVLTYFNKFKYNFRFSTQFNRELYNLR